MLHDELVHDELEQKRKKSFVDYFEIPSHNLSLYRKKEHELLLQWKSQLSKRDTNPTARYYKTGGVTK